MVEDHGITAPENIPQESIDRAVATVRTLAGWHIWPPRDEVLEFLDPGDGMIILPTKALLELRSLTINGEPRNLDALVWDSTGIVYVPGLHARRNDVPYKVTADIRHGFDLPGEIDSVVRAIAARSVQPQSSYAVGRISVGAPAAATPQSTEWRIIDEYRLGARP
ncbi:hypothetical protein ACEE90_03455 [Corynebacterium phoceense]